MKEVLKTGANVCREDHQAMIGILILKIFDGVLNSPEMFTDRFSFSLYQSDVLYKTALKQKIELIKSDKKWPKSLGGIDTP